MWYLAHGSVNFSFLKKRGINKSIIYFFNFIYNILFPKFPFIEETIKLFENESKETKAKVVFIHFNHTNPALLQTHALKDSIQNLGFKFAKEGTNFQL